MSFVQSRTSTEGRREMMLMIKCVDFFCFSRLDLVWLDQFLLRLSTRNIEMKIHSKGLRRESRRSLIEWIDDALEVINISVHLFFLFSIIPENLDYSDCVILSEQNSSDQSLLFRFFIFLSLNIRMCEFSHSRSVPIRSIVNHQSRMNPCKASTNYSFSCVLPHVFLSIIHLENWLCRSEVHFPSMSLEKKASGRILDQSKKLILFT